MFCHKCGNQIVEESAFCPKCGEKLIKDGMVQQTQVASVTAPESKPIEPLEASSHSSESKKKSKKFLFGLVGIAVVVIAVIVIVLNLGGSGKYPDELLYEGLPVSRFLDMTKDDIVAEFGEPDQTDPSYPGIRYDDKGITMINFSEETGKVIYMNFYTSGNCSFNGTKFTNKTAEQGMKIISSPERMITPLNSIEYSAYNEIGGGNSTDTKFFRLKRDNHTLEFITISISNKDTMLSIFLYSNDWNGSEGDTATNTSSEVLYEGVPLSRFFEMSIDEAVAALGTSASHDEFKIYSDDIDFRLDGDRITSGESFFPEKFTIDGATLDKDRTGLIGLLGNPSSEGDNGSGYELTYELENCKLTIATGDKDSTAWRIFFWPNSVKTQNPNSVEVLCNGIPLSQFFEYPLDDAVYSSITSGQDLSYDFGTGSLWSSNTSLFEVSGISLDKKRDELVSMLGNPAYDDWGEGGYYIRYDYSNYTLYLSLTDGPESKVSQISANPIWDDDALGDDGGYEEDYYDYQTPEIDTNLLGRWRSADGSNLELRENGSFSIPWSLPMPALCKLDSNNSYWEANNGRITISYHYNHHPRLDGFEIHPDSGIELMTLNLAYYYRCDTSQNGTGLVGEWGRAADRKRHPEPILVFREDYTGSTTDKEFTWMMSDGSPLMTYAATSSVDYTVYGDLLTIYFTDSSKVFTRVGN